ncbi:MAG: RNA methyltransferase [Nibricoccus sp.]
MKPKEIPLCGLAAVQARFKANPASIKRLYFDYATGRKIGAICKALAAARKVYRCVDSSELEKVAGTIHHAGIVAIVEARPLRAPTPQDIAKWARTCAPLLILDRVGNAHNLGAIARTAAFFGVKQIVVADHPQQALPGEAAYRISEGGLENLEIFAAKDLAGFCRELAQHYRVIGTAVQGAISLRKATGAVDRKKPVALVLGNEEHGLSPQIAAVCSELVTIPGTGVVESLNVSSATAVLCWEFFAKTR